MLAVAASLCAVATGCPPKEETSLPSVFGARITDGKLWLSTGTTCDDVTRVTVDFPRDAELILEPPLGTEADVGQLSVEGTTRGLDVVQPLPSGFDWRTADYVSLDVYAATGGYHASVPLADVLEDSGDHPNDTYFFGEAGWLNPQQVAEGDGREFMTSCTPDPVRSKPTPEQFGVRVTDGRLQMWAGRRCVDVYEVYTFFSREGQDPPQVKLELLGDGPTDFSMLTLGDPVPGLAVRTALPPGYDWRQAQRMTLGVRIDGVARGSNIETAEPFTRSDRYPADTFWFEGVGWLTPDQVARFDGSRFVDLCTTDPA